MNLAILAPLLLALAAQEPEPAGAAKDKGAGARREKLIELYRKDAAGYTIFQDATHKAKVELRPEPVYVWTNPVRSHGQDGAVFVWTCRGRAEVVGTIFSFPATGPRSLHHELHSLALSVLDVTRAGMPAETWKPEAPGIELTPIEGAPAPARSASQRLVQMRALTREFSATGEDLDGKRWEQRLLPQPLFRYESTDPDVIDGAVFAFVSTAGTDPEVLLVIEARRPLGGGDPAWQYGIGRFSDMKLWVRHRGKEVYTGPLIPYDSPQQDPKHRYRSFRDRYIPAVEDDAPLSRSDAPEPVPSSRDGPMSRTALSANIRACRLLACLLVTLVPRLADSSARGDDLKTGTRRALIVCGLPGDDDHRKLYADTVEKIHKALTGRYGFATGEILVRFGVESQSGDGPALKDCGLSNRERIESAVAELRRRLQPEDTVWVIVLGHAHLDGRHSYLNIPGPDLDERAFGKLFEGLKSREQVFWITTSASGFFLKPLAAPGRIVITATEADQEVNETLFPLALADALATPPDEIDRDEDGSISVFELYLAVVTDVLNRYLADENLPTEHAKIDDNGDGRGSESQERFLPPELGGPAEKEKEKGKETEKDKGTAPRLGPKDDGALASKVVVGRLEVPKP